MRRRGGLRDLRNRRDVSGLRDARDLRRRGGLRDLRNRRDVNALRGDRDLRRRGGLRDLRNRREVNALRGGRDLRRRGGLRDLRNRRDGRRLERRRLIGAETADRRGGRRRGRRLRRAGRSERKIVVFVKLFVFGVREIGRRRRRAVNFPGVGDLERRRRGFVNRREGREILGDAIFQFGEALDETESRFRVEFGRSRKLRPDNRGGLRGLRRLSG